MLQIDASSWIHSVAVSARPSAIGFGSVMAAAAIVEKRVVRLPPFLPNSVTASPTLWSCTQKPSSLTSYDQPCPVGGEALSLGTAGGMKRTRDTSTG